MPGRLAALVLALGLAAAPGARAQLDVETTAPVVLRADTLTHDADSGRVTATGDVEIVQDERILRAHSVTYDPATDTVTAEGDVVLLEPTGEVMFADFAEIRDELKEGVIRNIRIVLSDDSRFAANGALRTGGYRTEMRKAVFSPCRLCPDRPDRPPLWQIKAVRVVHDQRRRDIEYSDAFLEVFGVPVAYTPFFSHPDPTVKRRSGFLAPSYGSRSQLGFTLQIPYFFNFAPHRDATLAPIFTTEEGAVLAGEYRERTHTGQFRLAGSITYPRERNAEGELVGGREIRGHIEGNGVFNPADDWRWGFQLDRTTDDTYLRRYGFDFADTLTSNAFVENLDGRSYGAVNAFWFQGLEADDVSGETPIVAPIADYNYISDPGRFGERYTVDGNLMVLTRTDGTDSRRLSLDGGVQLPYIGPIGDVYTLSANLRGDVYWVDDFDTSPAGGGEFEGVTGRFVPRAGLNWRLPLVRNTGRIRQVIEPVAQFTVSPEGLNPDEIPNEDSQSFEFDDINLFKPSRFPGLDLVEEGPRLSYGVRLGAYGVGGGRTTAFIGQSFRPIADGTFESGSGLEDELSDYVGRVSVSPSRFFDVAYRFRVDRESFFLRRSEIDFSAGPDWLRLDLGFLSLEDAPADLDEIGTREEINVRARLAISPHWSLFAHDRRDLSNDDTIRFGFGLTYQDECVLFATEFERRFTEDRDIEPETTVKFVVKLKYLG